MGTGTRTGGQNSTFSETLRIFARADQMTVRFKKRAVLLFYGILLIDRSIEFRNFCLRD